MLNFRIKNLLTVLLCTVQVFCFKTQNTCIATIVIWNLLPNRILKIIELCDLYHLIIVC